MPSIFEGARRALASEVARRTLGPGQIEPGAWYGDGDLLLATRRTMLTVRLQDGARCQWLDLRERAPRWRVAVPRLELASEWIDAVPSLELASGRIDAVPRAVRPVRREPGAGPAARVRRRRARRSDPAQLELPLADPEPAGEDARRASLHRLFAGLEDRARAALEPVRPRWQWELLLLLDEGGRPALELFESTPALGFALALAPLFNEAPPPPLDVVLGWRQGEIARLLGFPASRRGVRALRKLEADELDAPGLLAVKRLLRDPRVLERVSHLPRLTRSLVRVARTPEAFLSLGRDLQLALIDPRRGPDLARRFESVVDRMGQLRARGFDLPEELRSEQHAAHVTRSMQTLVDEMGLLDAPDPVAPAPFPGRPGAIEPLRCVGDFHAEGEAMHNCVRSYVRRAMRGQVAVYRVLAPERATLSLVPSGRGCWRVGELYAFGNAPVRDETRHAVERWLALWRTPAGGAPLAAGAAGGGGIGPVGIADEVFAPDDAPWNDAGNEWIDLGDVPF